MRSTIFTQVCALSIYYRRQMSLSCYKHHDANNFLRFLMLDCICLTVHLPYFEDTQTCTSVCQPTSTTVPVNERAESAIHAYGGA